MYVPLLNAFILPSLHASKSSSPNAIPINYFNPPACAFNAPNNDIEPPFVVVIHLIILLIHLPWARLFISLMMQIVLKFMVHPMILLPILMLDINKSQT